MAYQTVCRITLTLAVIASLPACGRLGSFGDPATARPDTYSNVNNPQNIETNPDNTIWSIFNRKNNDTYVAGYKYLWNASLEVLGFLPVQSVDPFTGVISTGFGRPPGGGQVYRATILFCDPALDARSLNVALQTRGGAAVSTATQRAVEDAPDGPAGQIQGALQGNRALAVKALRGVRHSAASSACCRASPSARAMCRMRSDSAGSR